MKNNKFYVLILFMAMLLLSFVCLNLGSSLFWGNNKADFTSDGRYTLSEASEKIIQDIKEPIFIKIYMSSSLSEEYPQYADYARFVLRFLNKYQKTSAGKISLEIKNPEPYSAIEKEAQAAGIKPILDGNGQINLYFGAEISNDAGDKYTIPNFVSERRPSLEKDISRIIYRINNPQRQKIGLVYENLPITDKSYGTRKTSDWAFVKLLSNNYNLVEMSSRTPQIPLDINVLVIVNPQKPSDVFTYALDQFVLRGGRILMFLDPYSEKEGQLKGTANISEPEIDTLLQNWGISYGKNRLAGDVDLSEMILIGDKNTQLKNYYLWMNISKDFLNKDNPITEGLSKLSLKTAGILTPIPYEDIEITPLITTSPKGGSVEAHIAKFSDKTNVLTLYNQDNIQHTLALQVTGKFSSVFNNNILENTPYAEKMLPYIAFSAHPSTIVVVADTDMLADENWADTEQSENNEYYGIVPQNDNGNFILRAVDYLTGNKTLLKLYDKKSLVSENGIGEHIYGKIFARYAQEYNQTQQDLTTTEKQLDLLSRNIEAVGQGVSMKTLEYQEKLRQEVNQKQNKIKELDYKIKKEQEENINKIILMNTIVFPLLLILAILLFRLFFSRIQQRKISELVNER